MAVVVGILASGMALGDVLENLELLKALALPAGGESAFAFNALIFWTHVKWYSIFFCCLIIGYGYGRLAGFSLLLTVALVFAASGFCGILGLLWHKPLVELASLLLAMAWLLSTAHALKHWKS
jgi:hypothetical protein